MRVFPFLQVLYGWLPVKIIKPYHERNRHQAPLPGGANRSTGRPDSPGDPEQPEGKWTLTPSLMGPGPPMEEDGAWTMTEADDQAPAAEGNNPSMPHNVPFRHVPTT